MSLEVFVACAGAALLPAHLPTDVTWRSDQAGSYTTDNLEENWIIEVWLITEPKELQGLMVPTGTKSVVGVSIQGSDKADELAERIVESISARCDGTLLDA